MFSAGSLNFHTASAYEVQVSPPPCPLSGLLTRLDGESHQAIYKMRLNVLIKRTAVKLLLGGKFYIPGEPHFFQRSNHDPAKIKLPPFKPVSCRGWKGVVVVMPALTMA